MGGIQANFKVGIMLNNGKTCKIHQNWNVWGIICDLFGYSCFLPNVGIFMFHIVMFPQPQSTKYAFCNQIKAQRCGSALNLWVWMRNKIVKAL